MPAAGDDGRTSSFIVDAGMSGMLDYSSEFMFDEDGSPLPTLDAFDDAADACQAYSSTPAGDLKRSLSPSVAFANTPVSTHSPPSANDTSPDSLSDSASSRRTGGSASTKTTFTGGGGDVRMSDEPDDKADVNYDEYIHATTEDDAMAFFMPERENASSSSFAGKAVTSMISELASPVSTPSPQFELVKEEQSPHAVNLPNEVESRASTSSPVGNGVAAGFTHHNGPSHSATRPQMNGFIRTDGSRDVSPFTAMVPSHDSSPTALLNSPPTTAPFNFHGLPGAFDSTLQSPWSPFPLNIAGPEHVGMAGLNMAGLMSSSAIPSPFAFQGFYGTGPFSLRIAPTPPKSRVETQIPIKMIISPLPIGIKRLHLPTHTISKPKLLAKPTPMPAPDMLELHTILVCTSAMQNSEVRERALRRARAAAMSGRKNSAPIEDEAGDENKPQNGGEVHICSGCMTRERKRAGRKKVKKPEDEEMWRRNESRRVIVFNTAEVKEWQQPHPEADNEGEMLPGHAGFQMDAPMRIACYCRHHAEKLGFQVIFTITNHLGQFVAQSLSPSIMITDDHKTPALPHLMSTGGGSSVGTEDGTISPSVPNGISRDENSLSPGANPFHVSQSTSDLQSAKRNVSYAFPPPPPVMSPGQVQAGGPSGNLGPRNLSRPASPTGFSGPCNKKRKSSGSTARLPNTLTMTRLETTQLPIHHAPDQSINGSANPTSNSSPFSPVPTSGPPPPEQAQALYGPNGPLPPTAPMPQPFSANPQTPGGNDPVLFSNANRSTSMENMVLAQMYSAPASAHPSRAASPNNARVNGNGLPPPPPPPHGSSQFAQAIANSLSTSPFHGMPLAVNSLPPASVIHKIIPAEGPKSGGIEVTILGGGFYQGLEVMFGDVRATTTTFWGETSLVCLLPPSPVSGPVPVTFKQQIAQSPQPFHKPYPTFKYVDDDEQQLMRTAFAVLASKMTGSFEDTREIARRIIGDSGASWGASSSSGNQHTGGGSAFNNFALDADIETQLIRTLEMIDLDDSTHKARFNLRRSTGQTMLHLACAMGLNRFVAGLLARGASPDLRDRGGYTALHMAALNDHPQIVRRLICCGADPTIRTLSGLTAADVARSDEVLRAVRRIERHARSRSGGSFHSRASSATSLRSLWEPLSSTRAEDGISSEETDSSGESPEYSSGDLASEDEEGREDANDEQWLDMPRRNASRPPRGSESRSASRPAAVVSGEAQADLGSSSPAAATAVAGFRDQVSAQLQQWQQTMSLHLQNLPQFPQFPQLSQFPYLPQMPNVVPAEYQAAVQRLAAMMPHLGGTPRPESAVEGAPTTPKELEGRQWELSSLAPSSPPPPAYDEIFPQSQAAFDMKQASAAQAAAEAEADQKCAILFDQQEQEQEQEQEQSGATGLGVTIASTSSVQTEYTEHAEYTEHKEQAPQKLPALLQIGRKNAITKEQQENLRRAHAERLKRLGRDRNLFFIWIPLLIVIVTAMLYNRFPDAFAAAWALVLSFIRDRIAAATAAAAVPPSVDADRVVEVL